ncbi:hypothetical protein D3C77_245370 [compost metagenome]
METHAQIQRFDHRLQECLRQFFLPYRVACFDLEPIIRTAATQRKIQQRVLTLRLLCLLKIVNTVVVINAQHDLARVECLAECVVDIRLNSLAGEFRRSALLLQLLFALCLRLLHGTFKRQILCQFLALQISTPLWQKSVTVSTDQPRGTLLKFSNQGFHSRSRIQLAYLDLGLCLTVEEPGDGLPLPGSQIRYEVVVRSSLQ